MFVFFSLKKVQRFNWFYSYYLFAVGSRSNGYLRLGIQARMHETTLTAITSSLVLNEIQRINVTANVVAEQQVKRKDLILIEKNFLLKI